MSIEAILKVAAFTPGIGGRRGLPTALVGLPGIAKSALIELFGEEHGLVTEVFSPAERGLGALGAVPVPSADREWLDYPMPRWVEAIHKVPALVFIDELTACPASYQAPLLSMTHMRRIGGKPMGINDSAEVRVLCAYNPPEYAAGGWELSPPIANRMIHMEVEADGDGWRDFMVGVRTKREKAFNPREIDAQVDRLWASHYGRAVAAVTEYTRRNPAALCKPPKANDPQAGKAWPSLRTWDLCTRAIAGCGIHGVGLATRDAFIEGAVGKAAAVELIASIAASDLPDPEAVLDGTEPFVHNPRRLDRTYAFLYAAAAIVVPPKSAKRAPRADALWEKIIAVCEAGASDACIPAARALVKAGLMNLGGKGGTKSASSRALTILSPILAAAGIQTAGE